MTENIVCFDTETTGLQVEQDYIIQLSLVKFDSHTFEEIGSRDWYILPRGSFYISPDAEAVHHISKQMLEETGVSLKSIYPDFEAFVDGCDILSYNGNGFDARILRANLQREGLSFDFDAHRFYDALLIERARMNKFAEPDGTRPSCRLSDAYTRYYGHEFEDAHNSLADVRATIGVFRAQQEVCSMSEIENPDYQYLSWDGFLTKQNGRLVFAVGKYRYQSIEDVKQLDSSYIDWVLKKCGEETRQAIMGTSSRKTRMQSRDCELSLF